MNESNIHKAKTFDLIKALIGYLSSSGENYQFSSEDISDEFGRRFNVNFRNDIDAWIEWFVNECPDSDNDQKQKISNYWKEKKLKDNINNLTDRERKVLRDRFGIDIKNGLNLSNINKNIEVSIERIKQIEDRALKKLKNLKND